YPPPNPPKEIVEPGSSPGRPIDHPSLTAGAMGEISTRISNRKDACIVLAHERVKLPNTLTFNDKSQLDSILARMAKDGGLPAILEINSACEPFWTDCGGSAAGGSANWHVLAITAYDAQARKASVSDQSLQWPKLVSVADLYRSTLPPDAKNTGPRLKTGEQKALDFTIELELLWQQRSGQNISSERFDQQIASLLNRAH